MAHSPDSDLFLDPASEANLVSQVRRNPANLQFITDALPVLVSYVGADQRYRFVNRAYEPWFGVARAEIIGKHIEEVLGAGAYGEIRRHVEAALRGHEINLRSRLDYDHGGEKFVHIRYVPDIAPDGSIPGFVALISDISDEQRAKELREAAALRTERLLKVTAAMAEAVSVSQVLEALVDRVAEAIGASSLGLWLLSADRTTADLAHSVGYSLASRAQIGSVPLGASPTLPVIDAIVQREPLWIKSRGDLLRAYPHLGPLTTPGRAYCVACLPLSVRGELRGCLGFTFDDERVSDKDERDFLLLVARYSSQALERLRLLETERASRAEAEAAAKRLAVLSRASRVFALESRELGSLLRAVTEQVTAAYADGCYVALVPRRGQTLELAAVHHRLPAAAALIGAALEAAPPPLAAGLVGRVISRGEAVLLPVVEPEAMLREAPAPHRVWLQRHPPRSLVIVPLRVGDSMLGILGALRHEADRPFSPDDQRLLEELADRAVVAIQAARLHEANEQGRARAELLYELAAAVIRASTLEEVFDGALDGIERALGASRCSILTFDAEGAMRFRAFRGLSPEYRRAVEGHSPWVLNAAHPEPIIVPDVTADRELSAYQSLFQSEKIGALGFIPLVREGRLIGKFMVYYPEPRTLSTAELDMAKAIANHIAAAIGRFSALAELQQTVRFNEIFTGMLGHDLRNPLGAIMAGAHIAMRRADSDQLTKPLSRILSSGARMARMIDQLLDFTRMRLGTGFPLDRRSADLVPILREVIDELSDAHPAHHFRLDGLDGDTRGSWDADRISQVFSNLVANALQHGALERGVSVRVDGHSPDFVCVHVENGGAVPAHVLPRLFEPMAGGDRRGEKSHGLGLGLYISREIVRAHGGSINVTTSEGTGTRFSVHLPRVTTAPAARGRTTP